MKQPTDAGFKSTYSSGIPTSHCKTTLHSDSQIVVTTSERTTWAVICTLMQVLYGALKSGVSGVHMLAVQTCHSCLPHR